MTALTDGNDFDLGPARVKELLDSGEIELIDIREPYEWEAGRISGAKHIQLAELSARAGEIDQAKPVVFQCRIGSRSTMATEAFRASGLDAYNLDGGIVAWVELGLPLEPDDGTVADH